MVKFIHTKTLFWWKQM